MGGTRIIDIHAHIFPDPIAQKASESIGAFYGMPVRFDGTVRQLIRLYREADISIGCVHSVALTPQYISSINRFISETTTDHSGKLFGFGAIHPDETDIPAVIADVQRKELKGFKIHPDMQKFALDSPAAMNMFAMIEGKFPIIVHTGDPRFEYSHPHQMKKVMEAFPKLVVICAHLGGWSEWEDAWKALSSFENVYIDTSSSLYALTPDAGRKIIRRYDKERVLFGTDYPMWNPKDELLRLMNLRLSDEEYDCILHRNAERLLGII